MQTKRFSRRATLGGLAGVASLPILGRRGWAQSGAIRIGCTQTLSGPLAAVGNSHALGAKVAVQEINEAGGLLGRPVELVLRDTRANPNDAVALVHELQSSGINLFFGDAFPGPNFAVAAIAAQLDIVWIIASNTTMPINHELFSKNVFRAGQDQYMQYFAQAKLMADRYPNLKRWGTFLADNAGFRGGQEYLTAGLKKFYAAKGNPIEFTEPVLAKVGALDYRDQCAVLASQKIQAMLLCDAGAEALTFLKQALAFGFVSNLGAIADISAGVTVGPALKKDVPNNFWTVCTWLYESFKQLPMAQSFYKRVVDELKTPIFDHLIAQAHLATTTILAGIRNAKSTQTAPVIAAIETMTYDTIYGPMKFRAEDHQLQFNPGYIRVGPDPGSPDGYKIFEFVQIDWKDAIEPANPGKKFEL